MGKSLRGINLQDITLLHLGDIHYKYIDKDHRIMDKKDNNFPEKLDRFLPKKSCETIIKNLMEEIEKSPLAILISGDLSTYGEIESYKDCLIFLKEKIHPDFFKSEPFQKLFLVPGNHDIDRKLFSEDSVFPKFQPIKEALGENKFPEIPLSKINVEKLHLLTSSILMITINSCMGCGERKFYPDKIKKALSESIDNDKNEEFDDLYYENIDTPIISTEDMDTLAHQIESVKYNCLPIILTHHNLLPQKRSRIAMYAELLNSGYIRERLLMLNRPILYLHGHIHDDTTEIITSSKYKKSKVICIAAPLLFPNKKYESTKCGFNKMKIIYGNHGIPIGCEITYCSLSVGVMETRKERIRFWDPPNTMALITPDEKTVFNSISEETYLGDLEQKVNEKGKSFSIEQIEKFVDRLSWLGLVDYEQTSNPVPMRLIRKVVP